MHKHTPVSLNFQWWFYTIKTLLQNNVLEYSHTNKIITQAISLQNMSWTPSDLIKGQIKVDEAVYICNVFSHVLLVLGSPVRSKELVLTILYGFLLTLDILWLYF